MENSKGHGQSWKVMEKSRILSWNFDNCTEKFCNECEQWVCVDRQFSLLQPAGTVTTNSGMHSYVMFRQFREKCSADRSWKFITVGPGKSWKSHGEWFSYKSGHPEKRVNWLLSRSNDRNTCSLLCVFMHSWSALASDVYLPPPKPAPSRTKSRFDPAGSWI